jgi:hypothetical protein
MSLFNFKSTNQTLSLMAGQHFKVDDWSLFKFQNNQSNAWK